MPRPRRGGDGVPGAGVSLCVNLPARVGQSAPLVLALAQVRAQRIGEPRATRSLFLGALQRHVRALLAVFSTITCHARGFNI